MRRAALLAAVALGGCGAQAPADPGLGAHLHIPGAQFYPGAPPKPDGGPAVVSVHVTQNQVAAGDRERPLTGALDPDATSAIINLMGDVGYWVVPALAPDVAAPAFPTFSAAMDFSAELEPREYGLRVQASDAAGRFGEPSRVALTVLPPALPEGTLVVGLSWDTEADLDLHVVTPDKVEIFARNPNSIEPPPPGKPPDPHAWEAGGILDVDSNAQCIIDGLRREHVIWTQPPPSGTYLVRVDTFSLCDAAAARWEVVAALHGAVLARAKGTSGPIDAEGSHDQGAGVLALTFDVP